MIQNIKAVEFFDNEYKLREIALEDIKVSMDSIISVDGSTDTTGVAIVSKEKIPLYIARFVREKKEETPVQYKVRLKREFYKIFLRNRILESVYYEEPFIGYASAVANLMMLRVFVEELVAENDPELNYIKHYEINNKAWKKIFLAPSKCPSGTDLEKEAIRNKVLSLFPNFTTLVQDECDALGMGISIVESEKESGECSIASKKKVKPFKYNIQFMGADEDDIVFQEFYDVYKGPRKIVEENGIRFEEIDGRGNFNNQVYKFMDQYDRVLIIKFSSSTHCNLVLEHRIGGLAATYKYLYAIVWRKSRKN